MDSIRVSETPDTGSIPVEATNTHFQSLSQGKDFTTTSYKSTVFKNIPVKSVMFDYKKI